MSDTLLENLRSTRREGFEVTTSMVRLEYTTRLAGKCRIPVWEKYVCLYGIKGLDNIPCTVSPGYEDEEYEFDAYIRSDKRITIPMNIRETNEWVEKDHLVDVVLELEDEPEIKWERVSDTWWTAKEAERDIFITSLNDAPTVDTDVDGERQELEAGFQHALIVKNCTVTDTVGTHDTMDEAKNDLFNYLRHNRNP